MATPQPLVSSADRSLDMLRREIDSIDDAVHDLLTRRAEIATAVVQAKRREGGRRVPLFRPGREAEILRRLIARTRPPLAPELVVRVWRAIIVASTRLQGPFTVAVAPPAAALARDHFGEACLRPVASVAAVLAAVAKGRTQIGLVPLPAARTDGSWWHAPALSTRGGVRILGRLPCCVGARASHTAEALILGRQAFEPSSDDRLYVRFKTATRAPRGFGSAVAVASVRRGSGWLHLLETAMPLAELQAKLASPRRGGPTLAGAAEFLGGYARPIVLTAKRK